jgi:hypothetical protein
MMILREPRYAGPDTERTTVERTNNGSPKVEQYRAAPAPVNVPSADVARAVWDLLESRLRPMAGELRPRTLDDVAAAWLLRSEPDAAHDVAMIAFAVGVEVAVHAAREESSLFINDVFDALASRWSPTFRNTPGCTIWGGEKCEETLITARREMVIAGVDLNGVWSAVCNGIDGLYTASIIGGAGHSRGHALQLAEDDTLLQAYERIVPPQPFGTNRILLADAPAPEPMIASWIVAEREYDVMNIGEPTREVIKALEATRLFLDPTEVLDDVKRLTAQRKAHVWPGMIKAWREGMAKQKVKSSSPMYGAAIKAFMKLNHRTRAEYDSIVGRLRQAEAVARQVEQHQDSIDDNGYIENKTAYYKTRNRRFQPLHLWPTEVSSKEDPEKAILRDEDVAWGDAENDEVEFPTEALAITMERIFTESGVTVERIGKRIITTRRRPERFTARTSPRGRWFKVRAHEPEIQRIWIFDDGTEWHDEFRGPIRPLVGKDASGSMFAITACVLGWRDAEELCAKYDVKTLMAEGVLELIERGKIPPVTGTKKQIRTAVGEIGNHAYGAGLAVVLRTLREDPAKYGTGWSNLKVVLDEGRKVNAAIDLIVRMRDEYFKATRELVQRAHDRDGGDVYSGLKFRDPFDGAFVTWNRPRTVEKPLNNGATPLITRVPLGKPNLDGRYPADYFGDPEGGRYGKTGCIENLAVPGLIHSLDAAYLGHVVLMLRERGVRDVVCVHDCFLVPSDAFPILHNALEDATRPWFEGLGAFYAAYALNGISAAKKWEAAWSKRVQACREGRDEWPRFRFKDETTVSPGEK